MRYGSLAGMVLVVWGMLGLAIEVQAQRPVSAPEGSPAVTTPGTAGPPSEAVPVDSLTPATPAPAVVTPLATTVQPESPASPPSVDQAATPPPEAPITEEVSPVIGHRDRSGKNATLTDTPWIELPQSVQTVDVETIRQWGAETPEDAWKLTSGIQPSDQALGSRYGGTARIRGLIGSQTTLNGFAMPQRLGLYLGLAGVDSVSFMKGPADAVDGGQTPGFTAGGFGGQINVNSKDPGPLAEYGATLGLRGLGHDQLSLRAAGNQPLLGDTLAVRLDVSGNLGRKFYVPGDLSPEWNYAIAPSVKWHPIAPLTLTLRGIWQQSMDYAYQGIVYIDRAEKTNPDKSITVLDGPGRLQPYDGWLGDEDSTAENSIAISQLELRYQLASFLTANAALSYTRQELSTKLWAWSVAMGGPTSGANSTTYQQMLDTQSSYTNFMDNTGTTTNLAGRFNLVGRLTTGWWKHLAVIGGDVEHSETESSSTPWVAAATLVSFEDPVVPELTAGTPGAPSAPYHTYRLGALAQYQAELTQYARLLAGLRLDSHEYESTAYVKDKVSGEFVGTTTNYDKLVPSWRAGLVILPLPQLALYGNLTAGAQPQWGLKDKENQEITDDLTFTLYEAGVKAEPWRGLQLSATYFDTEQANLPETITVTNPDGSTFMAAELTGETSFTGWELAAQGRITPSWELIASYTYLEVESEATYTKYHNVAPHTWSAYTSYQLPGFLKELRLGAGWRFVDERGNCHVGSANCEINPLPAYQVVDLLAEYSLPARLLGAKSWLVRLNASNLLDAEYYTRVRMYTQTSVGEPFSLMLTMQVDG